MTTYDYIVLQRVKAEQEARDREIEEGEQIKKSAKVCLEICCWLVVFYVPSTARSFRDDTPIYCPLQRT